MAERTWNDLKADRMAMPFYQLNTCKELSGSALPGLVEVTKGFVANVERMALLGRSPFLTFSAVKRETQAEIFACLEIVKTPVIPHVDPAKWAEVYSLKNKHLAGIESPPFQLYSAISPYETFIALPDGLKPVFEILMQQQIVACWTTFETLVGDLWIATINAHPHELDRLSGVEKRIEKAASAKRSGNTPDSPIEQQKIVDKGIAIRTLHDITLGTYDLSSKMGEVLKAKVDFTKLVGIRRAYSLAFDPKRIDKTAVDNIDDALSDIALDALSQIRNVIVHKSGVSDSQYEANCKSLPMMPEARRGQPVLLDGQCVRILIDQVIAVCAKLLTTINIWLKSDLSPPGDGAGI